MSDQSDDSQQQIQLLRTELAEAQRTIEQQKREIAELNEGSTKAGLNEAELTEEQVEQIRQMVRDECSRITFTTGGDIRGGGSWPSWSFDTISSGGTE